MTDIDKAVKVLKSTNFGDDLPIHHKKIVESALVGELGENTGTRLVFEDLFDQLTLSKPAQDE
jgi:hypothetical protein